MTVVYSMHAAHPGAKAPYAATRIGILVESLLRYGIWQNALALSLRLRDFASDAEPADPPASVDRNRSR